MRAVFFFLFLGVLGVPTFGQQFFSSGGAIKDYNGQYRVDSFPIVVKNLPLKIDGQFGLSKICFDIVHKRVSELKIELHAPDGSSIWVSNRNGGDKGQDYSRTCFRSNGFSGYIHEAQAPFFGEYRPMGRIDFLNNGQNPNGIWFLTIQDLEKENAGKINFLTLTFENNPMPNIGKNPCEFDNIKACECPNPAESNCELLPDLVMLPRFTNFAVSEYAWNDPNYPGQLKFAATIANIGDGPLETIGKKEWFCGKQQVENDKPCADKSAPRQKIYQRVYQRNGDAVSTKDYEVGTNYFDEQPGHNHFHTDAWVEFRLVKKKKTWWGAQKSIAVATGRKVSYCLFDAGICNDGDSLCQIEGRSYGQYSLANYGLGSYADCKSERQGISVGGYDVYGVMYEGQYLQLPKNLPSGIYYLEIEIDPAKRYREKNKNNNILVTPVTIARQQK